MRNSPVVLPQRLEPGCGFAVAQLLAPDAALALYFAHTALARPHAEEVALDDAWGRFLAADVSAREDHPGHARSTMDGFAVNSSDRGPRRIVGDIAMGQAPPGALGRGETFRIPTGGALPDGADAVVPLEDVIERDGEIALQGGVSAGDAVSRRASDMRAGERALLAGRRIGAAELGVLATLGCARVAVFRKPRFGVLSTGDELVEPSAPLGPGQIRDSNRYAVAGALRAMGAVPVHFPRAGDTLENVRTALRAVLASCDGAVLTGGSSVGARDVTPAAAAEFGPPGVIVHGLRVKPGKPTVLAAAGPKPILGLPGNPASALMILEAVARPIVAACTGERYVPQTIDAVAGDDFTGREGWTWFVPVRLRVRGGRTVAEPLTLRSAQVSLLARASGYVTLPENGGPVAAGAAVRVTTFSSGGAAPAGSEE